MVACAGELVGAVADLDGKRHEGDHSAAPHSAHHTGSHWPLHRYGRLLQP